MPSNIIFLPPVYTVLTYFWTINESVSRPNSWTVPRNSSASSLLLPISSAAFPSPWHAGLLAGCQDCPGHVPRALFTTIYIEEQTVNLLGPSWHTAPVFLLVCVTHTPSNTHTHIHHTHTLCTPTHMPMNINLAPSRMYTHIHTQTQTCTHTPAAVWTALQGWSPKDFQAQFRSAQTPTGLRCTRCKHWM
jgi:hypothetical protein